MLVPGFSALAVPPHGQRAVAGTRVAKYDFGQAYEAINPFPLPNGSISIPFLVIFISRKKSNAEWLIVNQNVVIVSCKPDDWKFIESSLSTAFYVCNAYNRAWTGYWSKKRKRHCAQRVKEKEQIFVTMGWVHPNSNFTCRDKCTILLPSLFWKWPMVEIQIPHLPTQNYILHQGKGSQRIKSHGEYHTDAPSPVVLVHVFFSHALCYTSSFPTPWLCGTMVVAFIRTRRARLFCSYGPCGTVAALLWPLQNCFWNSILHSFALAFKPPL